MAFWSLFPCIFLKALEHCLQQIAAVLPVLSASQQPTAEGQLSGRTNSFLHFPYLNLLRAASLLQPAGTSPAVWGLSDMEAAQLHGHRGLPVVPGLAPWRLCLPSCCQGCGTGSPQRLLQASGSITHLHTGGQATLGTCTCLHYPFPFPWSTFPAWTLWLQNPHSERGKKSISSPFCSPTPAYSFHGYHTCLACWGNHPNQQIEHVEVRGGF